MLKLRLLTAAVLGSLFLGALFWLPDFLWSLFLLFFIVIGAIEWAELAGFSRRGRIAFPLFILAFGMFLLPDFSAPHYLLVSLYALLVAAACVFWLLLAPFWLKRRWPLGPGVRAVAVGTLLLLPPWLALIHLRQQIGPLFVLTLMATVWLADSAAYFAGKRFGRRKLAPAISPGKTWEGVYGGLAAVALFALGVCLWLGISPLFVIGLLIIAAWSVIGDLFESMIKRQAGKKDSGTLLPGHGGVLDRIDGLTSTLPLAAALVMLPIYLAFLVS